MSFMVTFKVDATPVPKGRARYVRRGNHISTYTPEKTRTYEALIKDSAIEAMGASEALQTPVSLYLYIRVPISASATKKRLQAIVNIHITKVYSSVPGVDICVKECLE